jgi:hypothetical protein
VAGVTDLVVEVDDVTIEIVSNELTVKDDGISTSKLDDLAVSTVKLGNDAVNQNKIADQAVGSEHLMTDAVLSTKIADNAVRGEHILDGEIDSGHLAANSVGNSELQSGAVTDVKLGAQSVGWTQLKDDSITGGKIQDNTIESEHYGPGSIDAEHIANDAVDISKIGVRVPGLTRRRGGHATDWDVPGSTDYVPGMIYMQCGVVDIPTLQADAYTEVSVTFPTAFQGGQPIVLVSKINGSGGSEIEFSVSAIHVAEGYFQVAVHNYSDQETSTGEVAWLAIGPAP